MKYERVYSPNLGGWAVEAIGSDGECYIAQFYGPDAEKMAKEYEEFKGRQWPGPFPAEPFVPCSS